MKNILEGKLIDESNFLKFDIKKLKNLSKQVNYQQAIDRLSGIRDVLLIAEKLNRLTSIGNRSYYVDAMRWLKGEIQLVNFFNVPQIASIENISSDVGTAFDNYTQNLLQNIKSEQIYSQIELTIEAVPRIKSTPINKQAEKIVEQAEIKFDEYKELGRLEINSIKNQFESDAQAALQGYRNDFSQAIDQMRIASLEQIDNHKNQAIAQLQQATALDDWGRNYDRDIEDLRYRLYGKEWDRVLNRNIQTIKQKTTILRSVGFKKIKWLRLILKTLYIVMRNIFSLVVLILSRGVWSLAGRRFWSYIFLVIIATAMVTIPVLSILGVIETDLFDANDPVKWLSKVALFLPTVIVFSIGYSFTAKNYRIYSNMLDQYKHRRAVARTAQGIILNTGLSDEGKEIRHSMTAAAAVALFEHKITGHLSKKEVESLGLLDAMKAIKG